MKIFISWSGQRSHALAKALKEWLPLILLKVDLWLSSDDIAAGSRWSPDIAQQLEETDFGIVCVTNENQKAPWLLFEAGALSKRVSISRVAPLLLDSESLDLKSPLNAFQSIKVTSDGIAKLVSSINESCIPEERRDKEIVDKAFKLLWNNLEEAISNIEEEKSLERKPKRDVHEILEELVLVVTSMNSRLGGVESKVAHLPEQNRGFIKGAQTTGDGLGSFVTTVPASMYLPFRNSQATVSYVEKPKEDYGMDRLDEYCGLRKNHDEKYVSKKMNLNSTQAMVLEAVFNSTYLNPKSRSPADEENDQY